MKLIYIAHPLLGDDSVEWGNINLNFERYLRFVAMFMNAGIGVLSWSHNVLTHQRGLTRGDADFYLNGDRALLAKADAVVAAGPEDVSSGMRQELMWAKQMSKPTYCTAAWLDSEYYPQTNPKYFSTWENAIIKRIKEQS